MRGEALDQRAVAACVVQQRQPQRHQQQPAQGHAAGGQHQALPERLAVAAGAPAHQPHQASVPASAQPAPASENCGSKPGASVARWPRLGGHAGLHRHVDHPDRDRAQREEEHREPVDRRGGAALQRRQREGGQHGQAGQAEHQGPVRPRPSPGWPAAPRAATSGTASVAVPGAAASATASTAPAARPARGTTATGRSAAAGRSGRPRAPAPGASRPAASAAPARRGQHPGRKGAQPAGLEAGTAAPPSPSPGPSPGRRWPASSRQGQQHAGARTPARGRAPPPAPYRNRRRPPAAPVRAWSRGPSCSRPSVAIIASSAPSAMARA